MTSPARPQVGGKSMALLKAGAAWGQEEFSRLAYRWRVTKHVARLIPSVSVTELYHSCLGAFPAVVKESLLALRVPDYRPRAGTTDVSAVPGERAPWEDEELDIVDFQWFFDVPSVERILSFLPDAANSSLAALGAPTVAALAAARVREVQLADISPRFQPGGNAPAWLDTGKITIRACDLDQPVTGLAPADMVVMDPPWHLEHYLAWLRTAVATCKPGGLLAVALPQPLTNRKAEYEIVELSKILRRIGEVTVIRDALSYVTPSFEAPVLAGDGLESLRRWRRADLAMVKVGHPFAVWDAPMIVKPQWTYRWLEGQVVRSWGEAAASDPATPVIAPADASGRYRLTSVGRSYLWSSGINLVTSRGRAAVVSRWGRLPQILDRIGDGLPPEAAIKDVLSGAPNRALDELTATILTLLDR
jgi:hypothetical protein